MNDYLAQILTKLKTEIPQLELVGISSKTFSSESNNILESQNNTIIKLLLTILQRIDALEEIIAKVGLDNKTKKYKTKNLSFLIVIFGLII